MATIDALMGLGVGQGADQQALADRLRGEQRQGQFFGLSTLQPVAQYGQNVARGAEKGAQRGGALSQALAKEATRKSERDEDYERKQADATLAQERRLEHATAQKKQAAPKFGKYEEYIDIEGNRRNVVTREGLTFTQDPETGELEQTSIAGWTKPEKQTAKTEQQGYYERFGTASQQKEFESTARETQNQLTVFGQYLPEYGSVSPIPGMGTLDNMIAKDLPAWASDEQKKQQTWWRDYKKQYENIERHKLFGSALTDSEQALWKSSNVGPDSSPEQIQDAMDTLTYLTTKLAYKERQNAVVKGRDTEYVNIQYSWLPEEFEDVGVTPKEFKGESAKWNALTIGQRQRLIKYMRSRGQ